MRSFFKIFFASFLSIVVFCLLMLIVVVAIVSAVTSKNGPHIASHSVLVIDLSQQYAERTQESALEALSDEGSTPSLSHLLRLIDHARTDNDISGIYVEADNNANGFASSNELREALAAFRSSKKFVI